MPDIIHRKKKSYYPKFSQLNKSNSLYSTENVSFNRPKILIFTLIIALVTFVVYLPTFKNEMTNWDDKEYLINNPLIKPLDSKTVKDIFFTKDLQARYWMGNYHPLTMLTLNICYNLSELDNAGNPQPFVFQLVNILLHVFNTILVFFIILKLTQNINIAFFAGLFFGIHTLHVESVAWIAERKDVLYTFFFLLAMLSYIWYVQKQKVGTFLLTFLMFFLSLLSKGQAVSFAFTIVLIDIFYKHKLLSLKVIAEKLPFFALSLIFGLIAIEAQKQGSALQVVNNMALINRIGIAFWGFTMYLLKLFIPFRLSAIYPYPDIVNQTIPAYFWLGTITFAAVCYFAYKTYKKQPLIFFGLAFFVANVLLLLQLIPVGSAIYSDRYVYIPSIGFFIILAFFVDKIKDKKIEYVLMTVYSIFLIFSTENRINVWKDSRHLWEDTVKKFPKTVVAQNNLGNVYMNLADTAKVHGDINSFYNYTQEAIKCFDIAVAEKPDYTSAFYNRGFVEYQIAVQKNDKDLMLIALSDFNKAIATQIDFDLAYLQRGLTYDWLGEYTKAINDFNAALQLKGDDAQLYVNRGTSRAKSGDLKGSLDDFNKALELNPQMSAAYANRGLAYLYLREFQKAIDDFTVSLQLKNDGISHYNRGLTYFQIKEYQQAIEDFQAALKLNFVMPDNYYYIGWSYHYLNQKELACQNLKKAEDMGLKNATISLAQICK